MTDQERQITIQLPTPTDAEQCAVLSEPALAKAWDTPEEDKAWEHLSTPTDAGKVRLIAERVMGWHEGGGIWSDADGRDWMCVNPGNPEKLIGWNPLMNGTHWEQLLDRLAEMAPNRHVDYPVKLLKDWRGLWVCELRVLEMFEEAESPDRRPALVEAAYKVAVGME